MLGRALRSLRVLRVSSLLFRQEFPVQLCRTLMDRPKRAAAQKKRFREDEVEGLEDEEEEEVPEQPRRKRRAQESDDEYEEEGAGGGDEDDWAPSKPAPKKRGGGGGGRARAPRVVFEKPTEYGEHMPIEDLDELKKSIPARKVPEGSVKVVGWNIKGIRALLRREGLLQAYVEAEQPDVLCLSEVMIDKETLASEPSLNGGNILPGYHAYWECSQKKGYSGVAVFSKQEPLSVQHGLGGKHDEEAGRLLTLEFDTHFVVAAYVPNSGNGLVRLPYRTEEWDPDLREYLKGLAERKPVVLTGDLNVAHLDYDIHNPGPNRNKSAGFCDSERENFTKLLESGFHDVWREEHPGLAQYTYFGARMNLRQKNKGWRLDYAVVSSGLRDKVVDSFVRAQVPGSDHVPVGVEFRR